MTGAGLLAQSVYYVPHSCSQGVVLFDGKKGGVVSSAVLGGKVSTGSEYCPTKSEVGMGTAA